MKLLPILTGKIKTRACDWTVEGKGGVGGLERKGKQTEERRLEEDGAESHGLQRLQVIRDLIAGE